MFLGLLGLPLYWGNPECRSWFFADNVIWRRKWHQCGNILPSFFFERTLFTSFHAIWECPPVEHEDKRNLHLLLEQLRFEDLRTKVFKLSSGRSGTVLSSHYALFHSLGLLADILRFIRWNKHFMISACSVWQPLPSDSVFFPLCRWGRGYYSRQLPGPWVSNCTGAIPWLLKYCNTQHKSAKFVCNPLAITISYHTRGCLVGNAYYVVNITGSLLLLHFDKDYL